MIIGFLLIIMNVFTHLLFCFLLLQTFVKSRKEIRIGDKIRNASKCGRHTGLNKWCMFTGSDIDFHDKTDELLHNNDALFTATPINEHSLFDGVIERDEKESDVPVSLNQMEFINDSFVIEEWKFRTLRNQNWLHQNVTLSKIARIYAREARQKETTIVQLKDKLKVCLCFIFFICVCFVVLYVLFLSAVL